MAKSQIVTGGHLHYCSHLKAILVPGLRGKHKELWPTKNILGMISFTSRIQSWLPVFSLNKAEDCGLKSEKVLPIPL